MAKLFLSLMFAIVTICLLHISARHHHKSPPPPPPPPPSPPPPPKSPPGDFCDMCNKCWVGFAKCFGICAGYHDPNVFPMHVLFSAMASEEKSSIKAQPIERPLGESLDDYRCKSCKECGDAFSKCQGNCTDSSGRPITCSPTPNRRF